MELNYINLFNILIYQLTMEMENSRCLSKAIGLPTLARDQQPSMFDILSWSGPTGIKK
jgi:hypothetical protein